MLTSRLLRIAHATPYLVCGLLLCSTGSAQTVVATLDGDELVVASAEAGVHHDSGLVEEAHHESRVHVHGYGGVMSSYPFRGHQAAESNTDPWWVTDHIASFNVGPGQLALGVWAAGDASGPEMEFEVPVRYGWDSGPVSTTVIYMAFPNSSTSAKDTVHEFGFELSSEIGAVSPSVLVLVDPIINDGAYASAGVSVGTDVGPLSFGLGASAGVSGYNGARFGGQDISTAAAFGVGLGAGFSTDLGLGFSYGFRGDEVLPHAKLTLGYSI